MRKLKHERPTIGVLAGWEVYTGNIHSFLDHVFRGVQIAARSLDCNLLIGCGLSSPYSASERPAWPLLKTTGDFVPVGPWNTDGLLIAAPVLQEEGMQYYSELQARGFPLVFAGDHEQGPSVIVDNEGGILQAIDHLAWHGHRQIAFIAGYRHEGGDSSARLRGYLTGLEQHSFAYDSDLVEYGLHSTEASYQAMQKIIASGKPFTAVITSNDDSAAGAMNALRDAGLVVPQDVAVIGFDDRMEARAQIPLLTTVHHPMFELGYQAVGLLNNILHDAVPADTTIRIPTHLIVRESCGCLPGAPAQKRPRDLRMQTGSLNDPGTTAYPIFHPGIPANGEKAGLPATQADQLVFPNPDELKPGTTPVQKRSANLDAQDTGRNIAEAMADVVYKELRRISHKEVEYLCYRLLDAFKLSLTHGSPNTFRQAAQQILEHIAAIGDDLYPWQAAISILKERMPELLRSLPYTLPGDQIENMLHQARIAISEVSRGQYSRLLVNQSSSALQIGVMTSRFFAAKSEAEVFDIFFQSLPSLGIAGAAVAYYQPQDDDPVAWSRYKTPGLPAEGRFPTRVFPPPGLYPADRSYQLTVLPLVGQDGLFGFCAFQTSNMESLGAIVRQLVAALRGVWLYREAVEARRMAEEANQMKSRFLSIVSHELRTPLNLIFGLSSMMLETSETVNAQEMRVNRKDLERIFIGAQHLESLIRDVLDLARSDVGQLNLAFEQLDLREVLDAVSVIGEQLATDKDLNWQTEISPSLPLVRGDRARLRQVVLNLVNNAVKFTAHGSVTLSAWANNGNVTVAVHDTGLGIPKDERELIFDEFRQSKRTSARGFAGLGLGLAICKRLVEMHAGAISVDSSGEEDSGSTFYVSLPAIQQISSPPSQALGEGNSERVLLLVKELGNSQKLMNYLCLQGFQVDMHAAIDPSADWLSWLQPAMPGKIILDLSLASEHGWEIIKALKENPGTRNIPVLFYTLETEQDSGGLLDLNFLTKPLSTTELADALLTRGLLDKKENRSPARSILVVDDDPDILDLHTRLLETLASGYNILLARNGIEALEVIRRERPALVLLDLMMPEMDGFCVLETMQAEDLSRNIPVIVLTGQALTEEDMERLNCGVAGVLNKGMFTSQETLEHITAALSRKRRSAAETQRLVLKAMTFIHQNYKDPISRSEIADYVGVSERHLARCFQQEIGLSPIIYLNRFRVKMAKEFLDAGQMSITDVALEVGFSTGGYFTRVFRDEVGISPREYLRGKNESLSSAEPERPTE